MARIADLSGEELQNLLDVGRDADSVELKLTVLEDARASLAGALGIDPLDAQIRQVFFFDTPDLALNAGGVVVRARRRQNESWDSVVKIRPVVPGDIPDTVRQSSNFGVEVDAMPDGYVCSGSFKGSAGNDQIREVANGAREIRKLLSKEQRAFYTQHAPEGLELGDLSVLGPIPTLRLKIKTPGFDRRIVGEMWLYPDGSLVVELSTKAVPSEAFQVGFEWKAFLESRGIDISGEQQTKTKTALEFFTSVL